jgi:hypothetical protein
MWPLTTLQVSAYYYMSLSIYICIYLSVYIYMWPRNIYLSLHTCDLVLPYKCPHTTVYMSFYHCYICVLTLLDVSAHYYICVLILLDMCPHTTTYVSAYYYICVLILLDVCPHILHACPHTTIYVFSFY